MKATREREKEKRERETRERETRQRETRQRDEGAEGKKSDEGNEGVEGNEGNGTMRVMRQRDTWDNEDGEGTQTPLEHLLFPYVHTIVFAFQPFLEILAAHMLLPGLPHANCGHWLSYNPDPDSTPTAPLSRCDQAIRTEE